jgi:hypothetical protein
VLCTGKEEGLSALRSVIRAQNRHAFVCVCTADVSRCMYLLSALPCQTNMCCKTRFASTFLFIF